jgi:hypothetical protein
MTTSTEKTPAQLVTESRIFAFCSGLTVREGILKTVRAYCDKSGKDYNSTVVDTFHWNAWVYGVAGLPPGMEDANGQIIGKAKAVNNG